MKEIKFRGKRVDNGEWIVGDLIHYHEDDFKILDQNCGCWDILHDGYEVIPESVGQFTGLKDRNEVEIYENDIIHVQNNDNGYNRKVSWSVLRTRCGWCVPYIKSHWAHGFSEISLSQVNEACEIIGNTSDNPELIKKA